MILTQAQAEAVYSAICVLNNVSGRIEALNLPDNGIAVGCFSSGVIHVRNIYGQFENHTNQAAFATAYGLQQG